MVVMRIIVAVVVVAMMLIVVALVVICSIFHFVNTPLQHNTTPHHHRVLTDGSEHLNSICRLVASESSASTQQTTVQNDN